MAQQQIMTLPHELGDGLLLRHATVEDAAALSAFNARIHGNVEEEKPDERIGVWVRDLMERPHPTFQVGDFTVVEEIESGKIVSSLNLISQRWSYAGVPFAVGRPELVGTDPAYRNRGLVRLQMELIHQWSAERGEMVQAITGIPFYYRQFGYEMTHDLGGGRVGYEPHVPKPKEDEEEPFIIRETEEEELPFIAGLYEQAGQRYLMRALRDEAMWRYELKGRSAEGINTWQLRIIQRADGEPVGYLVHPRVLWGNVQACTQFELKPDVSWFDVTPSVIRYLWSTGKEQEEQDGEKRAAFAFALGTEHPVYEVMGEERLPRVWRPYAWYMRVPDPLAFLRHITPVLDERLATSPAAAYSGTLSLSFYRSGVQLQIEQGHVTSVEPWRPPSADAGSARFPGLTFLHLLFGYRSLEELQYMFPDCGTKEDGSRAILKALFPKQPSSVWPIS